jgi:predicted RNA-binding Zn-ribbon protein involved in translation (DUF1610 family)
MSDLLLKCTVCGAMLDEEDLFCPNCGTEAPLPLHSPTVPVGSAEPSSLGSGQGEGAADLSQDSQHPHPGLLPKGEGVNSPPPAPPSSHLTTHNFTCRGCGASMSYDASAEALRCPFCGSEKLEHQPDAKEIAPESVVAFTVRKDEAVAAMRHWLGQGFWRPGDLAMQAAVVKITPVYVPYWVFQADTATYWTADTNQTPPSARGDWRPMSGQHEGRYDGLIIGASGALTHAETAAICPFDLSAAVPPEEVDLKNSIYERFTVPRKYARSMAREGLESLEAEACKQYVPGTCRNMHVAVRITNLASRPMLVPVWIMAYRYRDQVFRFLANGQTGKCSGQAPMSYRKLAATVAIAILAMIILLFLFSQFARGNSSSTAVLSSAILSSDSQPYTPHLTCSDARSHPPSSE